MFLVSFFNHARAVGVAARALGLQAFSDLESFALRVEAADGTQSWRPRFLANLGERQAYVAEPCESLAGFAGWLPYPLRQWPIAGDKAAFKQYAEEHGILTPAACRTPQTIGGPFLVKHVASSFGQGIRGPYLAFDPTAPEQRLGEGEYYENFMVGLIAKAWCWGETCVALELQAPSIVTGTGCTTLRELVAALPNTRGDRHDWPLISRLARYSGVESPGAVPPADKQVLVEFRYGSRYAVPPRANTNMLARVRATELGAQFAQAARTFSQAIPPQAGVPETLFTLDAIVDADGKAWFLEMNCNPLVHPDAYASMLASSSAVAGASTAPMPPRNKSATTGAIAS